MKRTPVESSNIASIGHDVGLRLLEIEFVNGGIYQYKDVPMWEHVSLMSADSHGKHFTKHIKDNYDWMKVEQDAPGEWNKVEDTEPLSECCGAPILNYNDGMGICRDCKEWTSAFKEEVAPLTEKPEGSAIAFEAPKKANKGRSGSGTAIIAVFAFVALTALYGALRG